MLDIERNNAHTFLELVELLKGKKVYVQTHNFPDPDAIGAGFGMQYLLKSFGVDSVLCYHGKIDRVNTRKMVEALGIRIFSKEELGDAMGEDDPIICIDSQKNSGNMLDLIGDEVACVDHHPTQERVDYFYKDVRIVGSCATIVTDYLEEYGLKPPENVATALLYGIQMDTGGFVRGVTDQDIHAFGYLYPLVDKDILLKLEQNQMEFQDLKAYGTAVSNIVTYDTFGFAAIPFPCQDALIAITCDFVLSIEEISIAVVYSVRKDGYKFSIRSADSSADADCGKIIAAALDGIGSGGGHAFMAGGFIPAENISQLGKEPDKTIAERFLRAHASIF